MTWLQHWTDVLFVHYRASADQIAARLPAPLEVDTYGGAAWLSFVFFQLKLRPAGLPFIAGFSSLAELNVRTYVRYRGRPGIYFLRMFADNPLAIWASKWLTPLRYELAAMISMRSVNGCRHVECRPLADEPAMMAADFNPCASASELPSDSLDAWLLERYRLFVALPQGSLIAGDVEHAPWKAANIQSLTICNSMRASMAFSSAGPPTVAHYSPGVQVRFLPFKVVSAAPRITTYTTQLVRRPLRRLSSPPSLKY